jgi:exopolyphosphatase / guanosine-5'-triphosphate,3'-diphosphate pyrophosphatase
VTQNIRRAIIDIGSNSIRLVVFGGAPRAPITLYNEKSQSDLGRSVIKTGMLDENAIRTSLAALARFKLLVDMMDVGSLRVVATAAVRSAQNGDQFLEQVKALGLNAELLSGAQEAYSAGMGVIAAMPGADGVAVDLGGGSLELVRINAGQIIETISLPIGILHVPTIQAEGDKGALKRHIQGLIAKIPWLWRTNGLPLYLVGGSWRALARVHMHISNFPLTVLDNYAMPSAQMRPLADEILALGRPALKQIPSMPSSRVNAISDAAELLAVLVDVIDPSDVVTCTFGIREGILFEALNEEERQDDPLIVGARYAVEQQQRFTGYGDALAHWVAGLFGDQGNAFNRLRHASCLLADLGWSSSPKFRATAGIELALHGNWIGVTPSERAIMAEALYASFGSEGKHPVILSDLADDSALAKAKLWGVAIWLANRLSGGAAEVLLHSNVKISGSELVLTINTKLSVLDNESVRRRLTRLNAAIGTDKIRVSIV